MIKRQNSKALNSLQNNKSESGLEDNKSKKLLWSENALLLWGLLLIVSSSGLMTNTEPFILIVVGRFGIVFILAKVILGDSLRFNILTIPSFFMLMYLILMPYGSILMFDKMTDDIKYTFIIAVHSVFITFPIGIGAANLLVKRHNVIINKYTYSNLTISLQDIRFRLKVVLLALSSIPILFAYFKYSEYVQLVEVIKAYPTGINIMTLKFAGSDDLPRGVQYAFELVRRFTLPVCVLFAFFMSKGNIPTWKYIYWILLPITLVVSSLTLDRAPPVAFLVMVMLGYIMSENMSVFRAIFRPFLLLIFIFALTVGGLISTVQYQSEFTFGNHIDNMEHVFFYRILQDVPYMAAIAFETFNQSSGFLFGKSMRILSILPGYEYVESQYSSIYSPAAPVGFVADLWRNFGWFGVIGGTILIGFAYQLAQLKLFISKSALTLSINVLLLIGSIWIIYGNVLGVMSTSVLFFGILFGWLYTKREKPVGRSVVSTAQIMDKATKAV